MVCLQPLLMRLVEAHLTFNLAKCEFAKATVRYLGHGEMHPIQAKILDIQRFPPP